jgi:hypothetical protein
MTPEELRKEDESNEHMEMTGRPSIDEETRPLSPKT